MFGVLLTSCSMFTGDFGAAEGGQIVGLLKDCLQSLLGIVEEEKKGDQKWHKVMAFLMGMNWEESG